MNGCIESIADQHDGESRIIDGISCLYSMTTLTNWCIANHDCNFMLVSAYYQTGMHLAWPE